jgi:hypothetical protein
MMAHTETSLDRSNQSAGFYRKFWFIMGIFFALFFCSEIFKWTRGRGDYAEIAITGGFTFLSLRYLSKALWMQQAFLIFAATLLTTGIVMRILSWI